MSEKDVKVDIDDPVYRTTPMQQALASCAGALLTSLFVTPLDVVKIRLQAQQKSTTKCFLYCNGLMDHICECNPNDPNSQWYRRPGHFNGTFDAFVKIARNEGIASFWSGLSPTLVLAVPATIVYFVTYEQLRLKLKDDFNKNRPNEYHQPYWIPLVSGATARLFSTTLVSPLELMRTKMQSRKLSFIEIQQVFRTLIHQSGIVGLWKGVFPTLLRDVPFSAIYWMNYETLKSIYGPGVPSFTFSFLAGAISGGIAATATVPFDVVKTLQQIDIGEKVESNTDKSGKLHRTGVLIRQIYRHHGIRGLFTGLVPRLIKVAPACAIMIATFEYSKVAIVRLANKTPPDKSVSGRSVSSESDSSNISDMNNQYPVNKLKDVPDTMMVKDFGVKGGISTRGLL